MKSECKELVLRFQELNHREVVGQFDGRELSKNGGRCCFAKRKSGCLNSSV